MATISVKREKLPKVCPRFFVNADDSIEELSREEMALLGFRRCLPDGLNREFDKVFEDDGRPFSARLKAFMEKAEPHREQIIASGWSWWA